MSLSPVRHSSAGSSTSASSIVRSCRLAGAWRFVIGILALGGLLVPSVPSIWAAEPVVDWATKFREEAPRQWREYLTHFDRVALHFRSSITEIDGDRRIPTQLAIYDIKRFGDNALIDYVTGIDKTRPPERRAGGSNERYGFSLIKTRSGEWRLLDVAAEEKRDDTLESARKWGAAALRIVGKNFLDDMLPDPGFTVKQVVPVLWHGREMVEVEFDFKRTDFQNSPVTGGKVVLDPNQYWLLYDVDVRAFWGTSELGQVGTIRGSREYLTGVLDVPVVSRVVHRNSYRAVNAASEKSWFSTGEAEEIREFEWRPIAEFHPQEYQLSGFGLTEPSDKALSLQVKGISPKLLYLLVGNVVLFGGFLFWLMWRRKSA